MGVIKTKYVVNCTGVWAPYIGEMVNIKVPLLAMYHAYVVTERIEGIQNMPNIRDHDTSIYLKLQGDGLSAGGYEHNPIFWDNVSKREIMHKNLKHSSVTINLDTCVDQYSLEYLLQSISIKWFLHLS